MARKRNTIVTIVVVLLLLALAVGLIIELSRASGDNENEVFGITVNGKRYEHNAEGLVFGKTMKVTVTVPSGSYDVSIKSVTVSKDFELLIGEEVYSWSNTVYQDFTSGFNVTKSSDGFTMTHENLISILSDALGYPKEDIRVPDVLTDEDLFVMIVTSGEESISIGFTLEDLGGNMPITSVSLDSSSIVF